MMDKIETTAFYTWMGDDGIVRTVGKNNVVVELEQAMENSVIVNSFPGPERVPLIVDPRGVQHITKEARDYFSVKNRNSKVFCMAFIVSSPLSRVIVNFFIQLSNPQMPTKMFSTEEKAVEWCMKQQKIYDAGK